MSNEEDRQIQNSLVHVSNPSTSRPEDRHDPEIDTRASSDENPIKIFFDRMHGRWRWVFIIACVFSPLLGVLGYALGKAKYSATAVLVVESKLDALVRDTPETAAIAIDTEVVEQSQLIRNPQVTFKAANDPALATYKTTRPTLARDLVSGLEISVPRRSSVILVSVSDEDPNFAAAAANSVVRAYLEVFVPSNEIAYQEKVAKLDAMVGSARTRVSNLKRQRIQILSNSRYATIDARGISEENVASIRVLEDELDLLQTSMNNIKESFKLRMQKEAISRGEEIAELDFGEPEIDETVPATTEALYQFDRGLQEASESLADARLQYELISQRFGSGHDQYRRAKANLEALEASYENRISIARQRFEEQFGDQMTWGALKIRRTTLLEDMERIRELNAQIEFDRIKAEELDIRISNEEAQLGILQERLLGLEREKDSIRQGRVAFRAPAVPSSVPTSDKKAVTAVGGAVGGVVFAVGIIFLLSCFDQKIYGVRQLQSERNELQVLGVLPDMNEAGAGGEALNLARDCIHRIRGRIESRRGHASGFTMMVSSPFQGDGKTTFAISLGWSYAESGYRTLLLDTDFIGRSMTHQFGRLRSPGLREAIKSGSLLEHIIPLGHPDLHLVGIGCDRRVTAANLSPRIMSSLIEEARQNFDIIIIDSGPLSASIEAMSVAAASDGGILCLQKGRSRERIRECISDFALVGSQYLGVVLNYASRRDCEQYGSTSRMSAEVEAALQSQGLDDADRAGDHMIADLKSD